MYGAHAHHHHFDDRRTMMQVIFHKVHLTRVIYPIVEDHKNQIQDKAKKCLALSLFFFTNRLRAKEIFQK